MAEVVGLTLVKRFPYRGDASEEFSNQYWLTGAVPADHAAWLALADAMGALEQPIFTSDVEVLRAYGYDDNAENAHSVWSWDFSLGAGTPNGTLVTTADTVCPGDAAVWVRWATDRLNSDGKRIFLRKYYHPAVSEGTGVAERDLVSANQRSALQALGDKLSDGTFIDGRTIRSAGNAETGLVPATSPYVTTRTLKRRGKRNPSSA